jgi:hypothetical protein
MSVMKGLFFICIACFCISTTVFSQNVGIGTASPQHKLHVHDAINNSTVANFSSAGGWAQVHVTSQGGIAQMGTDPMGMYAGTEAYGSGIKDLRLRTNAYDRVIIKELTGNVGLSINTPAALLHVNGDAIIEQKAVFNSNVGIGTASPDRPLTIKAAAPNNELFSFRDTANTSLWHVNMLNSGLNFAQTGFADGRIFIHNNGMVGIRTINPDRPLTVLASGVDNELLSFRDTANIALWHVNMLNGGFNLAQTNTGNSRLFINNAGNAGIGTTNPVARLHVQGTGNTVAVFSTASGIAEVNINNTITNNNGMAQIGLDGVRMYVGPVTGNRDLGFKTSDAYRIYIKNTSGNVGVGLESPAAKLHVSGDAIVENKLVINDTAIAASLRVTGAVVNSSASIVIAGGPQTINPGNRSCLFITNTGVVPATITLGNGVADGQLLYVLAAPGGGGGLQFVDNTLNNTQLSANYVMGIDDTLTLIWNATRSSWIELHRSVN